MAAICEEAFAAEVLESAAAASEASVPVDGVVVVVAGAGVLAVVAGAGVVVAATGVVAAGVVVAAADVAGSDVVVPAVGVVVGVVVPAAGVVAPVELSVEELLGVVVEELEAGVELALEVDCRGISSAKKVVVVVSGVDVDDPEVNDDCAAPFKFDDANSVPSISPSPFLSRTLKSWLAAV